MELILARKVRAVALTGVPYSRDVLRLLAIHIYHKLVTYNIYNQQGQRKNPENKIDENIHAVEHTKLATRYLVKSSKKTEYH